MSDEIVSIPVFLGQFNLTEYQSARLHEVQETLNYLRGLSKDKGGITAKFNREVSRSEIDAVVASVNSLPDIPMPKSQDKIDFSVSPFSSITPAQAETWIQNNVTDLASAKDALKKIAKILIYLIRRSDLQ